MSAAKHVYQAHQLQAEAKLFSFECRNVKPDGNCFFHAVLNQFSLQGLTALGTTSEELRATAMNDILTHLNDYKDFLAQHDGSLNDFIERNVAMGTWADHLIISALSRALNIKIVIPKKRWLPLFVTTSSLSLPFI